MATHKLIGQNFLPPDVVGKVTGKAKYAEDFRAEGMLFAKLYRSPMPHGKVRSIDIKKAQSMPGVVAILTPDDVPKVTPPAEPILASEPVYTGEPIVAVAAVDESTAAEAVEQIKVDLQPLPFVINPLDSLRPDGPDARTEGNVANRDVPLQRIKWTAREFASFNAGKLPMGKPAEEWQYGDIEAGFKQADLVVEETFVTQASAHHSMEPRSALAYWQGGKVFLHGSSQSLAFVVPNICQLLQVEPANLVFISEHTGGGFGSKAAGYTQWGIPALLAKKAGRPVMLRVTRDEEHDFGRARPGFQGWIKLGFRKDGRILAADMYVIQSNGPYDGFTDWRSSGLAVSLVYQPIGMRWRGIPVLTNTPPRSAQRGPGQNQIATAIEPILDKAARKLGVDRVAIRLINAPGHDGKEGPKQEPVTSSYLPEALKQGAEKFGWSRRQALSGRRNGSKATGVGVGVAFHTAGSSGFDGLVLIKPDGKLYIHNGTGNLGTYSYAGTARAAAETLGMPWERCEIVFGNSARHLPWNNVQAGSNTSYTMTRTNYVAAMDAKAKLQEIAAKEFGGDPAQYDVADGSVFQQSDPAKALSFADAAKRAIALGGKYSGKELPENLNPMTARSAAALAGQGLLGVAKDTLERKGIVPAFAAGFVEVQVDTETGQVDIADYLGVGDCGTVIHPQGVATQILGGAVQGFGMARTEKHVHDPKFGIAATRGLNSSRLPTYLDIPHDMKWSAVDEPDASNPIGSKGIGEPPMGAAAAALVCAISDALGGVAFNRTPVTLDMILSAAEGKPPAHKPLDVDV